MLHFVLHDDSKSLLCGLSSESNSEADTNHYAIPRDAITNARVTIRRHLHCTSGNFQPSRSTHDLIDRKSAPLHSFVARDNCPHVHMSLLDLWPIAFSTICAAAL